MMASDLRELAAHATRWPTPGGGKFIAVRPPRCKPRAFPFAALPGNFHL